jgi:SRSO17 transposase
MQLEAIIPPDAEVESEMPDLTRLAVDRQTRWRPQRFMDVEWCGERTKLVLRCERLRALGRGRPARHRAASRGVARQYTGSAGKIANCQIGVFAAYVSARGHAFVDRALYLPKIWTSDPTRLAAAHVLEAVAFATKSALAVQMIWRALVGEVPFSWVAADAVYSVGDVEQALRRACKGCVLGVRSDHHFGSWGDIRSLAPLRR